MRNRILWLWNSVTCLCSNYIASTLIDEFWKIIMSCFDKLFWQIFLIFFLHRPQGFQLLVRCGQTWRHNMFHRQRIYVEWLGAYTTETCQWRLWQYRLKSFQTRGTKSEGFLPKNQHTQRILLSFKNWISMGLRSFKKSEF